MARRRRETTATGPRGPGFTPEDRQKAHEARRAARAWTREEAVQQRDAVAELLTRGTDVDRVARVMRERFGVGRTRTNAMVERVRQAWAEQDATALATNKGAAIRRIYGYLRHAAGARDAAGQWTTPPNHQALARYESLLADLQGTREAVEVRLDVRVSNTVMHVIANMGSDQVAERLAEWRETRRLAEERRLQLVPRAG